MSEKKTWGLLAEFETTAQIYHACESVRDAGYRRWDAHTPFPVHGLEKAMGLPASFLPWLVFGAAMFGAVTSMAFQWWVSVKLSPQVIAAKPLFSWQAFVPVTFEVTILCGAATAVLSMLAINGLPRLHHPLFSSRRFERATDDRFFISIEAADPKYDDAATTALLEGLGATHIERIKD